MKRISLRNLALFFGAAVRNVRADELMHLPKCHRKLLAKKRKLANWALASLLVVHSVPAQQPGAADAIQQRIATLGDKAHVRLHLSDGSTVSGRIVNRNDLDFALKSDKGGTPQTIAYKQVTAVEQIKGQHSKTKWIVIGIVAGAAIAVAAIAIHAEHSPKVNGI